MEAVATHSRANLSRVAVSFVVVALAAAVCVVAFAQWSSASASRPDDLFSSGARALAGGSVDLPDHQFLPGDTVSGTVVVQNSGDAAGRFTFGAEQPSGARPLDTDTLARTVRVKMTDVTDPAAPVTVYRGRLCDLTGLDLGAFAAGALHTYHLELTLPAGASTTGGPAAAAPLGVTFGWTAVTSG